MTQQDVAIFRKLDDWMFDYSLIGAPWGVGPETKGRPRVGNGGYTLRHVDSMKTVLKSNNYTAEYPDWGYNEDVWWNHKIQNLPSEAKAAEFSIEHAGGKEDFVPTAAHQQWSKGPMKNMGQAFRLLQQYGRCI